MRISRNLKKSTIRVCELLYTSGVQVYNHGRLSWREITYLVSSFFPFSLFPPLRGQLILIIFIRVRFRRVRRRYGEREREKKASRTLLGWKNEKKEERRKDGRRRTRNKGVHYMPPGVAALPLFLLRDVLCATREDSLDYHLSLSLSNFFFYFWTTIITNTTFSLEQIFKHFLFFFDEL